MLLARFLNLNRARKFINIREITNLSRPITTLQPIERFTSKKSSSTVNFF